MNFKIICKDRNDYEIPYTAKIFAGGEVQVQLGKLPVDFDDHIENITIDGLIKSSDMFMELSMIVDALFHVATFNRTTADLHYLPYARQDRVCTPGEAFALAQFIGMMREISVNKFIFDDVHSKVAGDLLSVSGVNYECRSQTSLVSRYIEPNSVYIISPDKGAEEKAGQVAFDSENELIIYSKIRNLETGRVEETTHSSGDQELYGKDCLIVDDLADFCGTFIPIAQDLKERGAGEVNLYVTHLVLPVSSERIISSGISNIFYTNKFNDELGEVDKVFHASQMNNILGEKV